MTTVSQLTKVPLSAYYEDDIILMYKSTFIFNEGEKSESTNHYKE